MGTMIDTATYDIFICVDCGMLIANGEPNPEWSETDEFEHVDRMEHNWPSDEWVLAVGDSERDEEFSWAACDSCSSTLGGYRFHAVAMGRRA